jgi:hypothetical protein
MDEQIRKSSLICQVGRAMIGQTIAGRLQGEVGCSFRLRAPRCSHACRGEATGHHSVKRLRCVADGAGVGSFAEVPAVRQLAFARRRGRGLASRMVPLGSLILRVQFCA